MTPQANHWHPQITKYTNGYCVSPLGFLKNPTGYLYQQCHETCIVYKRMDLFSPGREPVSTFYPYLDQARNPGTMSVPLLIHPIPAPTQRLLRSCNVLAESSRKDVGASPNYAHPALFPDKVTIITCEAICPGVFVTESSAVLIYRPCNGGSLLGIGY